MTAIIVLIVCSLIVAGGFLFAFLLSVKSGQYDDTYTPAVRMLFEDLGNEETINKSSTNQSEEIQNPKH